ncbi:MAG: DUF3592 domain-containing protein [Verrucomicrobiales bacterium]|nr:DUF3592 domain-containing protein [Verrucomicrobiales bacterium]
MLRQFNRTATASTNGFTGCFAWIFYLGFGLPGIAIACWIAVISWNTIRQSSWEKVPAEVISLPESVVELDDATVPLSYRYRFAGQTHVIEKGKDFLPGFSNESIKRSWLRAEAAHWRLHESIPCWVNPQAPAEHALVRIHPSVVTYLLGLFTFSHGFLGISLWAAQKTSREQSSVASVPGQSVIDVSRSNWLPSLAIVLLLNSYVVPPLLAMVLPKPSSVEAAWMVPQPIWVPPLVLCVSGLLIWVVWRWQRSRRISRTVILTFPPDGIQCGQSNSLQLRPRANQLAFDRALLQPSVWSLTCVEKTEVSRSSSTGTEARESKLDGIAITLTGRSNSLIGMDVTVPSTSPVSSDSVRWEVWGEFQSGLRLGPFPVNVSAPAN